MPNPFLLLGIGCASGYLAGLLGAGGGFATVVLLIAAGVTVHVSIGTSLVYILLIALWGTILHVRQGTASVPLALALGIPAAITAVAGAQLGEAFSERTLTFWFAILTACVAVAMLRKQPVRVNQDVGAAQLAQDGTGTILDPTSNTAPPGAAFVPHGRPLAAAIVGGLVVGLAKGLFGVGGGFLLIPYMLLVLNINENIAVGSSLLAILIGSIVGGLRHATLGNVDTQLLAYLVPAGLLGSFFGARASKTASPVVIRRLFIALMVATAIYLFARSA